MKSLYCRETNLFQYISFRNNMLFVKTILSYSMTSESIIVVDKNKNVVLTDIFYDVNNSKRYFVIGYYQDWLDKIYNRYPLLLWQSSKKDLVNSIWNKIIVSPVYVIDPTGSKYKDESQYISRSKKISFKYVNHYDIYEIKAGNLSLQSDNTLTWSIF